MIYLKSECPISRNISLLESDDPQVKLSAVEALGRFMSKRAVEPLLELTKTETDVKVRRSLMLSLSLLGDDKVLPILLDVIKNDSDIETRRNAAGGLRFFGDKINAQYLVSLMLDESDKSIRNVLVSTVIFLRDKTLIPQLLWYFEMVESQKLKECLLEIMGSFDDQRTKELLIKCISPEFSREIRLIATISMGKLDDVSFIPHLFEIYKNDENEEIRIRAEKFLDELSILLGYSSIDQMVLDYIQKSKEV